VDSRIKERAAQAQKAILEKALAANPDSENIALVLLVDVLPEVRFHTMATYHNLFYCLMNKDRS
jgi:hypothetical protein